MNPNALQCISDPEKIFYHPPRLSELSLLDLSDSGLVR